MLDFGIAAKFAGDGLEGFEVGEGEGVRVSVFFFFFEDDAPVMGVLFGGDGFEAFVIQA